MEDCTEQCYREGLALVTELDLLWGYYIQWCRERVEGDHVEDAGRLRVSAAIDLVSHSQTLSEGGRCNSTTAGVLGEMCVLDKVSLTTHFTSSLPGHY